VGELTLILGGARSGKSTFAEKEALRYDQVGYLATAEALDAEMTERIRHHRAHRPSHWITVEEPLDLEKGFQRLEASGVKVVLLDCLTLYLSNQALRFPEPSADNRILERLETALRTLQGTALAGLIVSNEVGLGLVPETALGRRFRDLQGQANQRVARLADRVFFLAAGIPLLMKGTGQRGNEKGGS